GRSPFCMLASRAVAPSVGLGPLNNPPSRLPTVSRWCPLLSAPALFIQRGDERFPVIRDHRVKPGPGLLVEALAGTAPDLFVGWAAIQDLRPQGIGHPEDRFDVLGQLPEPPLRFVDALALLLALGDVLRRSLNAEDRGFPRLP